MLLMCRNVLPRHLMALLDDLVQLAEQIDPAAKPALSTVPGVVAAIVSTLEAAGIRVPSEVQVAAEPAPPTPEQVRHAELSDQVLAVQDKIATVAGSSDALSNPAAFAAEVAQLHDELTSLQVQIANLERAQLVVTHDVEPEPAA